MNTFSTSDLSALAVADIDGNPIASAMLELAWAGEPVEHVVVETAAEPPEDAEPATQIVRKFSPCGPCLTIGKLVRETAKFYVYRKWLGCSDDGYVYETEERRIGKSSLVHTEPCRCCRDHADTSYPNGYMD